MPIRAPPRQNCAGRFGRHEFKQVTDFEPEVRSETQIMSSLFGEATTVCMAQKRIDLISH
jgi:hypothetical protein